MISSSYAAGPIRVAIVDTGLDLKDPRFSAHLCPEGHTDFTGEGIQDLHSHGTHVAGIIVKYAGKANYCLIILKYFLGDAKDGIRSRRALAKAVELEVDVVNMSGGGAEGHPDEAALLGRSSATTFIVAAGNGGVNIDHPPGYYPASYNFSNVVTVGSIGTDGKKSYFSNYGNTVDTWELGESIYSTIPGGYGYMSGSSMATAAATGRYIGAKK